MLRYMFVVYLIVPCVFSARQSGKICEKSLTTASGTHAPEKICSGDLIFEDNFDNLNCQIWEHENTLAGGGNWEFQWYTNNRSNSFAKNGILHIRPTLTSDIIGEEALYSATLDINGDVPVDSCTNALAWGCSRTGSIQNVLNPIRSARIRTLKSFSFKYGRVEVKAKMPTGDWLWPAIWLKPRYNEYGLWPASGEIDLVESRGNENLILNGKNIGVEQANSSLHWGPDGLHNEHEKTQFEKNSPGFGFNRNFRTYQMEWTPEYLKFSMDGSHLGTVEPKSFWDLGEFGDTGMDNPWQYGTKLAPFDQEFYFIINLAVGGVTFFPDDAVNPKPKPWLNNSTHAATDFWSGRNLWLPTWRLNENKGENASLQVDYVRVWAL